MSIRRRTVIASGLSAAAILGLGLPALASEVSLAKTKDLVTGRARNFSVANRKLLVYKTSATSFSVFDATCPHDGRLLTSAMLRNGRITCATDKSVFNATTGKKVSGPSATALVKLKHRVANGVLLVTLPTAATPSPSASAASLISAASVPLGGGVRVESKNGPLIVVQPQAGEYFAYSAICTHAGCEVSKFTKDALICTCHNSEFSTTGGRVISGPARTALAEFKLTLKSGELFLAQ